MTRGIAVVQEGTSVSRALDSQKVLDSRWKYLEIAFEEKLPVSLQAGTFYASKNKVYVDTTEVFSHDLGFLPAFEVTEATGGKTFLRIYNLDITAEYNSPIVQTLPSQKSSKRGSGVKIVAPDHSSALHETELTKFSLNTSAKVLAIQRTGSEAATAENGGRLTITHNLGYPPTFFTAQYYKNPSSPGVGETVPAAFGAEPVIKPLNTLTAISSSDSVRLIIRGGQGALLGNFAFVIFKELADFAL